MKLLAKAKHLFGNLIKLQKAKHHTSLMLLGPFPTYTEALRSSTGYDHPAILEKVKSAVSLVLAGECVYERDGTTFMAKPEDLAIIAVLENHLKPDSCVIDFGGGLGGLFASFSSIFSSQNQLIVIEQENWVDVGTVLHKRFNSRVVFANSFEDIVKPDIIILSSVLMYLPDPFPILQHVAEKRPCHIIVDRTAFTNSNNDNWYVQHEATYYGVPISYPFKLINKSELIARLPGYRIRRQWKNEFDVDSPVHLGLHLERIDR